jgi:hypothetical protein
VFAGGLGEGLLEGADEVCVGGFEGMLLGSRGSLVYLSALPVTLRLETQTYLCSVVDLERRLVRRVEVAVVAQCVVLAHNDLVVIRS